MVVDERRRMSVPNRISVSLTEEEQAFHRSFSAPLRALCPGGRSDVARLAALAATSPGRTAMRMDREAQAIGHLCTAKRLLLRELLERHRHERVWIVAADARDAFTVSSEHLVPMITEQIAAPERARILEKFGDRRITKIVSDRAGLGGLADVGIVLVGEERPDSDEPRWSTVYELVCAQDEADERAVA